MKKKTDAYTRITSMNLRRIRESRDLSQPELAAMIGSTPGRISAYETAADSMGTDYIERVCRALKGVEFWQFFIDENTPIIKDDGELRRIKLHRIEEQLGIVEEVREHEEVWIARAQRKETADISDLKTRARKHYSRLGIEREKVTPTHGKDEKDHPASTGKKKAS